MSTKEMNPASVKAMGGNNRKPKVLHINAESLHIKAERVAPLVKGKGSHFTLCGVFCFAGDQACLCRP